MSRTFKDSAKGSGRERRISVRGVRRQRPDLRRMSRALIEHAWREAAAQGAAATKDEVPSDESKATEAAGDDSGASNV